MNPETNVEVQKIGKERLVTGKSFSSKYAGAPCDLDTREPCTLREMINYYYYIKEHNPKLKLYEICKIINEKVKHVWSLVNSSLPLQSDKTVLNKISREITKVININVKKAKCLVWKKNLDPILDRLFDISACVCELPAKRQCNDRYLK